MEAETISYRSSSAENLLDFDNFDNFLETLFPKDVEELPTIQPVDFFAPIPLTNEQDSPEISIPFSPLVSSSTPSLFATPQIATPSVDLTTSSIAPQTLHKPLISTLPAVIVKQEPFSPAPAKTTARGKGKPKVALPREELLKMSSVEVDSYAKQVAKQRPLSSEDQKTLRSQKRKVKNRESAQASRNRKKTKIDELELEISGLEKEQKGLTEEVTALEASNKSLKDEVIHIQRLIEETPALNRLWRKAHQLDAPHPHHVEHPDRLVSQQPYDLRAAGITSTTQKKLLELESGNDPALASFFQQVALNGFNDAESSSAQCQVSPAAFANPDYNLVHAGRNIQQSTSEETERPLVMLLVPPTQIASLLSNRLIANNSLVFDVCPPEPTSVSA